MKNHNGKEHALEEVVRVGIALNNLVFLPFRHSQFKDKKGKNLVHTIESPLRLGDFEVYEDRIYPGEAELYVFANKFGFYANRLHEEFAPRPVDDLEILEELERKYAESSDRRFSKDKGMGHWYQIKSLLEENAFPLRTNYVLIRFVQSFFEKGFKEWFGKEYLKGNKEGWKSKISSTFKFQPAKLYSILRSEEAKRIEELSLKNEFGSKAHLKHLEILTSQCFFTGLSPKMPWINGVFTETLNIRPFERYFGNNTITYEVLSDVVESLMGISNEKVADEFFDLRDEFEGIRKHYFTNVLGENINYLDIGTGFDGITAICVFAAIQSDKNYYGLKNRFKVHLNDIMGDSLKELRKGDIKLHPAVARYLGLDTIEYYHVVKSGGGDYGVVPTLNEWFRNNTVKIYPCKAREIDVEDNYFDLITIFFELHHEGNTAELTIDNVHRMAKPGAGIAVGEYFYRLNREAYIKRQEWISEKTGTQPYPIAEESMFPPGTLYGLFNERIFGDAFKLFARGEICDDLFVIDYLPHICRDEKRKDTSYIFIWEVKPKND